MSSRYAEHFLLAKHCHAFGVLPALKYGNKLSSKVRASCSECPQNHADGETCYDRGGRDFGPCSPMRFYLQSSLNETTSVRARLLPIDNSHSLLHDDNLIRIQAHCECQRRVKHLWVQFFLWDRTPPPYRSMTRVHVIQYLAPHNRTVGNRSCNTPILNQGGSVRTEDAINASGGGMGVMEAAPTTPVDCDLIFMGSAQ